MGSEGAAALPLSTCEKNSHSPLLKKKDTLDKRWPSTRDDKIEKKLQHHQQKDREPQQHPKDKKRPFSQPGV